MRNWAHSRTLKMSSSDNHWPWIRHSATATPPLLGDTYRLANPTICEFTRYPQGRRTSSSRLDYIFISPASLVRKTPFSGLFEF